LQVLWLDVEICPLGGVWEISSPHFLLWHPLRISEINRVWKLKFGKLAAIYE